MSVRQQDSEAAAHEFFEHALIGMARTTPTGRFTQVNRALCEMLGYTRAELLALGREDVTHPEDIAQSRAFVASLIAGPRAAPTLEKRLLRKDGSVVFVRLSATVVRGADGEPLCFLTQLIDVSEQRRRLELQDAQAHVLEMVATGEPLSAVLHEIVRRAEVLNPDVRASVLLLSADGLTLHSGAAPSLPAAYSERIDGLRIGVGVGSCGTSAATGRRVVVEDVRNHPYWAPYQELVEVGAFGACWSEPILDAGGRVLGTFAMYYREPRAPGPADLEFAEGMARLAGIAIARRRAEQALRESEARLRITLDSIADAVIATDAEGRVTGLNPVAEQLTGWAGSEALGRPLPEVFRVEQADALEAFEQALRQGRTVVPAQARVLLGRDGRPRRIAESAAPIRGSEGAIVGAVLVFRDVSAAHELQERLRQAQKMEAVGQLAGGVAHDFNNLLVAILGNAELLTMSLRPASPEAELAGEILGAGKRAADLVRQLLAFSRKGRMQSVAVDLHALIREVVALLSRSIDKRIEVATDLQARGATVIGDPSQLQNALLNLGLNARDAMPSGGRLAIATREVELDGDPGAPAPAIELSVSDTGVGMSPAVRERIFEPFFTTKDQGRGTGLGLAGVYGTVHNHGGRIQVASEPGQGTTFRVVLPLSSDAQMSAPAAGALPAAEGAPVKGQGRVLVVDDEEAVRSYAGRALKELGYAPTLCKDGGEALALFETRSREFDLVVLDLMMPVLSGLDTFRRMKAIRPDVRVLVSSGFSQPDTAHTLLKEGVVGFLSKPFQLDELARELARVCPAR